MEYDKWGPKPNNNNSKIPRSESDHVIGAATFYFIWAILTYLLTIGKSNSNARTWSFVGLIISLFCEFSLLTSNWDPIVWMMPYTTQHEKVLVMHSVYPAFMNGCRLISMFTFIDYDLLLRCAIGELLETNRDISIMLVNLQNYMEKKRTASRNADGTLNVSADSTSASTPSSSSDAHLPLHIRAKRAAEAERKAAEYAVQNGQKKGGIPGWLIMLGLYFVFNYLLK